MTFRLTPAMAAGMYEYLRTAHPFRKISLPHADSVGFRITRHTDRFGHFIGSALPGGFHDYAISEVNVTTSGGLLEVVAHEMLHHYQEIKGTASERVQHNRQFRRLATIVCRTHGFDYSTFI